MYGFTGTYMFPAQSVQEDLRWDCQGFSMVRMQEALVSYH